MDASLVKAGLSTPANPLPRHCCPLQEACVERFRQLLQAAGHWDAQRHDYHTLFRFLKACNYDPVGAKQQWVDCLQWRRLHGADTILGRLNFPEKDAFLEACPQGYHKTDRLGRPVFVQQLGCTEYDKVFAVTNDVRMTHFHIHENERLLNVIFPACSAAVGADVHQSFAVIDMAGVRFNNLMRVKKMMSMFLKMDQANYPETLGHLCIINAPDWFGSVFKFVKQFMAPATQSKIEVVPRDQVSGWGPTIYANGSACANGPVAQHTQPIGGQPCWCKYLVYIHCSAYFTTRLCKYLVLITAPLSHRPVHPSNRPFSRLSNTGIPRQPLRSPSLLSPHDCPLLNDPPPPTLFPPQAKSRLLHFISPENLLVQYGGTSVGRLQDDIGPWPPFRDAPQVAQPSTSGRHSAQSGASSHRGTLDALVTSAMESPTSQKTGSTASSSDAVVLEVSSPALQSRWASHNPSPSSSGNHLSTRKSEHLENQPSEPNHASSKAKAALGRLTTTKQGAENLRPGNPSADGGTTSPRSRHTAGVLSPLAAPQPSSSATRALRSSPPLRYPSMKRTGTAAAVARSSSFRSSDGHQPGTPSSSSPLVSAFANTARLDSNPLYGSQSPASCSKSKSLPWQASDACLRNHNPLYSTFRAEPSPHSAGAADSAATPVRSGDISLTISLNNLPEVPEYDCSTSGRESPMSFYSCRSFLSNPTPWTPAWSPREQDEEPDGDTATSQPAAASSCKRTGPRGGGGGGGASDLEPAKQLASQFASVDPLHASEGPYDATCSMGSRADVGSGVLSKEAETQPPPSQEPRACGSCCCFGRRRPHKRAD